MLIPRMAFLNLPAPCYSTSTIPTRRSRSCITRNSKGKWFHGSFSGSWEPSFSRGEAHAFSVAQDLSVQLFFREHDEIIGRCRIEWRRGIVAPGSYASETVVLQEPLNLLERY